ncbi:MAG: GNAT family N-acetyltransferase [Chloroflexi bacterium]|nr:GNAT family N-acetyltransferase [Chloroflexota bacterium]
MTLEITHLDDPKLLLEINNAAVPDVGTLTEAKAEWLVTHVATPGLALLDDQPVGVLVILNERSGYDSDYFRWFTARYTNFLYIDRIVVAASARGQGIARALYQRVIDDWIVPLQQVAIASDVYSDPPNEPSLALHRAMGFEEVGTQAFPEIGKLCAKLMKYVEYVKPKHDP